jgi:glucokinase
VPQYVLAIDLGGTKCAAAVVDRAGRIVRKRRVEVDVSSPSAPISQIVQLAKDLAGDRNPKDAFAAMGIAVPGMVRANRTVWAPNLPGWERMPLKSRVRRLLAIPVVVESDRNAAVLGECWRGAARGKSDAIVLIIGTGIGAGILSGGRLVRGAHELSGCAGWIVVSGQERAQSLLVGELESMAAGPAIVRAAQKALRRGAKSALAQLSLPKMSTLEVANAARGGDRLATKIFDDSGRVLGFAVANLVSLFDPEMVIIGGGMAAAADLFLEPLKKAMMEHAQPLAARQVKIAVTSLGDSANLLGCARVAWETVATRTRRSC